MWPTIFVINQKTEIRPEPHFPPFTEGGKIMLTQKDKFDDSLVYKKYTITQVIFDVYSIKQYVHLREWGTGVDKDDD